MVGVESEHLAVAGTAYHSKTAVSCSPSSATSPKFQPSSNGSPTSPTSKLGRAYRNGVEEFSAFTGLRQPAELRGIIRAHVIVWRKHLESRFIQAVWEGGRRVCGIDWKTIFPRVAYQPDVSLKLSEERLC